MNFLKNLSNLFGGREHFLLQMTGGVAAAIMLAVFISGGGVERTAGTLALFNNGQANAAAAGTNEGEMLTNWAGANGDSHTLIAPTCQSGLYLTSWVGVSSYDNWTSIGLCAPNDAYNADTLASWSGPDGDSHTALPPTCPSGKTLNSWVPVSSYDNWTTVGLCSPTDAKNLYTYNLVSWSGPDGSQAVEAPPCWAGFELVNYVWVSSYDNWTTVGICKHLNPPPPPPSMSNSCTGGTISLSWGASPGANSYAPRVMSSAYTGSNCPTGWTYFSWGPGCYKDNVGGTSVTLPGILGATYAQSWVHAVNSAGFSPETYAPAGFTCEALPPTVRLSPTSQTLGPGESATIRYTTTNSPTSATYTVDGANRGAVPNFRSGARIGSFSIAGLAVGTHTVTMTVSNTAGVSAPSNTATIIVSATCPNTNALNYGAAAACTYVGCSLSANPSNVVLGSGTQASTFTWSSSDAVSCSMGAGEGYAGGSGLSGSGTTQPYTAEGDFEYTLSCVGPNNSVGPTNCNTQVDVQVDCASSGGGWGGGGGGGGQDRGDSSCAPATVEEISVSASPATIKEDGSATSVYTITNSSDSAVSGVRYTIANGNGATCGVGADYTLSGKISSCATSGSIASLPSGNSTVTLTAGSQIFSGTRSVVLTILPPSFGNSYQPASSPNNAALVSLTPNVPSVTAAPTTVEEGNKTAVFTINNPRSALSNVAYTITNGNGATCGAGADYTLSGKISSCATSGTIASLPSGNSTVTLTTGNTTFSGSRPVTLRLTSGGSQATVNITTNPGTMGSFTANPTRVHQGEETALSWNTSGFTTCALTKNTGGGVLSTHQTANNFMQTITSQTIFTLTCTNPSGAAVAKSVTVNLIPTFIEI